MADLEPTKEELELLGSVVEEKEPDGNKVVEEKQVKEEVKEEVKESQSEIKAREMGWKPEDEYQGDKDTWVDAGEFIRRKPLFDEIHKNKRKVADIEKSFAKLKDHHERVREAAYKQAIEDLKAEKLKALEDADHKRVVEIDDELAEKRANVPQRESEPTPEFLEWVEENQWYNTDKTLKKEADRLGVAYHNANPDTPLPDVFKDIEGIIKSRHPEKFKTVNSQNTNRSKPAAVESSGMQSRVSKSYFDRLSREDQEVVNDFISDPHMKGVTREQYAKDYLQLKGEKV